MKSLLAPFWHTQGTVVSPNRAVIGDRTATAGAIDVVPKDVPGAHSPSNVQRATGRLLRDDAANGKAAAFASSIAASDGSKLATPKLQEHFASRRS
jgi:hypothetical protein